MPVDASLPFGVSEGFQGRSVLFDEFANLAVKLFGQAFCGPDQDPTVLPVEVHQDFCPILRAQYLEHILGERNNQIVAGPEYFLKHNLPFKE